MYDKEFLQWLLDRLQYKYGEDPMTDFMTKLNSIIEATPSNCLTPNIATIKSIPENFKYWIDNADYEALLKRWRFSPTDSSDTIFQGEIGKYYQEEMGRKERELEPGEKVAISKRIGWDKK